MVWATSQIPFRPLSMTGFHLCFDLLPFSSILYLLFTPALFRSFFTLSLHLNFGRPLLLPPSSVSHALFVTLLTHSRNVSCPSYILPTTFLFRCFFIPTSLIRFAPPSFCHLISLHILSGPSCSLPPVSSSPLSLSFEARQSLVLIIWFILAVDVN